MQAIRQENGLPSEKDDDYTILQELFLEILPTTPEESKFTKEEFASDAFNVDKFIEVQRRDVSLEKLRELLSLYLKRIRLALNDLINQDYADFVNLSTNLVGLDKSIHVLKHSLSLTRDEIASAHQDCRFVTGALNQKIIDLKTIRDEKQQFNHLIKVAERLDKLEHTARTLVVNGESFSQLYLTSLERVAIEVDWTEKLLGKVSLDIPLSRNVKRRCKSLSLQIIKTCEETFLRSVQRNDVQALNCITRIYEITDRSEKLETFARLHLVRPFLDKIISDSCVTKYDLEAVYNSILEFVDKDCKVLKNVDSPNYDFLANSIWLEISERLCVRRPIPLFFVGGLES